MGASGWSYFVPYQQDIQYAFHQLQHQVFASAAYRKPWEETSASDIPLHSVPTSIEELRTMVGSTGTHSILDLPATLQLQPVSAAVIEQIFATEQPTHSMIEMAEQSWELWALADGDYLPVYVEGKPQELFFFGATGD